MNFNNYKNSLKGEIKFNTQRENRIDDIMLENENLLKVKIEYYSKDKPNEKNTIRIFGIDESLKLLDNAEFTQYFIDGIYKCIPHSVNSINVLILLIAYNSRRNQFEICLIAKRRQK